jgi:flagellar P-ring protein precursor FlgI
MAVLTHRSRRAFAAAAVAWIVATGGLVGGLTRPAAAARIKDLVDVEGVRSNQLSGYGVVVGLEGTGDGQQAVFTIQSVLSMLKRRGVTITVDPTQIRLKNAAAVVVTATLPPFAHSGNRIDIQVASIGDAKSLRGGTLTMTPLVGGDQQVYAVAQGQVSIGGGFTASAPGASTIKAHPTTGIITDGAIVEREVAVDLASNGLLRLSLRQPDLTTASRVALAINDYARERASASAIDPATIDVHLAGDDRDGAISLLTAIETLNVTPDRAARVILNERTGTIIMGEDVHIAPVAIAHGSLQIEVKTEFDVSQPLPFSSTGQTVVVPDSDIAVKEGQKHHLTVLRPGVNLGQLVSGLNALGVTPQDLIAVLEAIKAAGALDADLEIM